MPEIGTLEAATAHLGTSEPRNLGTSNEVELGC